MSTYINNRYTVTFSEAPTPELLLAIEGVFFDHIQVDTMDIAPVQKSGDLHYLTHHFDTSVPVSHDDIAMLDEIQSLSKTITGALSIDVSTIHCAYTYEASTGTSDYITRIILSAFLYEMMSALMGSFDGVLPPEMMPTVVF